MDIKIRQSELSGWANCHRKTALGYFEGYTRVRHPSAFPPAKSDIGTIVHKGLEFKYRDGLLAHEVVHAEAKRIEAEWAELGHEMAPAWKDAYNLAFIMCKGYEEWVQDTGVDAGLIVTGVEREIEVYWGEVQGHKVWVTGHIDLEGIDALGRAILIDHKSVQTISEPEGPVDFQRLTYAVLRRLEDGTTYSALYHNQLRRVKRTARATPPFYARPEVSFNDAHLRKHYQVMNRLITEIVEHRALLASGAIEVDSHLLYARPSRDCSWACPFYNVCPGMDDGSDWKYLLESSYEKTGSFVPGTSEEDE